MALNSILWPVALIIATVILFYNVNRSFKFYCKMIVYYIMILIVSFLGIPPALSRPFEVENTIIVSAIMLGCTKMFNINVEIRGSKYLQATEPCVVVCNHQSAIDVIGMMKLWPVLKRCVPIIKQELRYALSFGILATLCGSVFIDRLNPQKARETTNKTVAYLKEKNTKVWVFPEGTRNCNGTMLPFKKGAFHIAIQGELPILPVIFSSYQKFYDPKKKIFGSGTIIATVLEPISTKGLTTDDIDSLSERTRNLMLKTFYETSGIDATKVPNGPKK